MRKTVNLTVAALFIMLQLFAQQAPQKVTGKVTDEKGAAVPNASVVVKGTKIGTSTLPDGTFTLTVPPSARTLVVTSIGFITQDVSIAGKSSVEVTLQSASQSLDEVVVVAYGTVKKSEYVGSAAQISAKDMEKRPLVNVADALVGAAPGIQATTPGGAPGTSPDIRLRGFGSLTASSAPIYVIDGIVYTGLASSNDVGLANINMDDVESISVLKDASAAALYGSRAGNGVILITTKKGRKNSNSLTFKASHGFTSRGLPEYDRLGADQWYPLMWESYKNNMIYASGTNAVPADAAAQLASGLMPRNAQGLQIYNGKTYSDITQLIGYNPYNVASTSLIDANGKLNPSAKLLYPNDLDWYKAFLHTGQKEDYSLSYNGGNDKSDFTGSFGYNNEEGFALQSYLKRFVGRIGVNTNPVSWFKTGLNIAGTYLTSSNVNSAGGAIANPFAFARNMGPVYPVHIHDKTTGNLVLDANGNPQYDPGDNGTDGTRPVNAGRHAIEENQLNQDLDKRTYLSGRAYADINFLPYLTFTTKIGADFQENLNSGYDNSLIGDGAPAGRSSRTNERILSYTFTQLLNFNKKFHDHNVAALVGHENYDYTYNYLYGFSQNQIFDGNTELTNFTTINSLSSQTDRYKIESYFGKVNYDYKGKYIAELSIRRDGNSKFYTDTRWANFWSAGLAWRIDQEAFMKEVTFVNQLKLRYSFGRVGNDGGISNYAYQALYSLGFNNGQVQGIVQRSLASNNLTWEGSRSSDWGVDFALFKNRLSGTIEYYNRVTDRLLLNVSQPLSNGGTTSGSISVPKNVGKMYNRGVEISLTGNIVHTKSFNYNLTVNATTLKNKVTQMDPVLKEVIQTPDKWMAGHSRYEYYLRHFYGVDPADGMALYSSPITYAPSNSRIFDNGKGGKDTVTTLLSNANLLYARKTSIPDVYGSIVNAFSYKNFDLSFTFIYQLGGYSYDDQYQGLMHSGNYGYALHKDALKAWTTPGQKTNVPRMESNNNANFDGTSDRWLTKASYLNLNNVSLAYNFYRKVLGKINAKSAKVYVSGENLFWVTKRKGMNPSTNFDGTQSSGYPPARIVSVGVNVGF